MPNSARFFPCNVHPVQPDRFPKALSVEGRSKPEYRRFATRGRSRGKHEGESSAEVCDRLCRTRVVSQRQLPTDHDYAVSTREYQLDQSSPLPASAAADPVLERQQQKQSRESVPIDRSLHIN
jgi:hypothetical protein